MNIPVLLLAACTLASIAAADFEVMIPATGNDRLNAIVTATVPDHFPETGQLVGGPEPIPFQRIGGGNTIVFVVPHVTKSNAMTLKVALSKPAPNVSAELANGRVELQTGGKRVFTYQGEESELPREDIKPQFKRGGYLRPVYSPSGKIVTDDYPPNHVHHHGIWFPWTKTSFEGRSPDFWNMGDKKGKVEFVKFGETWSGPVAGGFTATHRFIDLTASEPKAVLDEVWTLTVYHVPNGNYSVFDLVSTQTCGTSTPLKLPKYHYGGLGFRGNWAWNGAENTSFLTSNGETDRVKGNETRGNWCHIGGEVDGQFTGIAILGHPSNFRAPQPMRLHPSEPFFCFAPSQLGDWEIAPGTPYVSRYRFIVADGDPDKKNLDALWLDYAEPIKAKVDVVQ